MFFIVCPAYPPVSFIQKDELSYTSMLPKSNTFCVFTEGLLEGQFARVFVRLDSAWEQLGVLTPQKLSAFFKVKGLIIQEIGIQIENGIPPQVEVNNNTSLGLTMHIAKKLITHLENYVLSFASGSIIPLNVFQNWTSTVQSKLENDPQFLE